MDTNSCGAAAEMCFGGDRFERGLSAVDTNSCGAAADMCFGGDPFERVPSAMETSCCGASNLYLEATGSHLGRDTSSLLMLFIFPDSVQTNAGHCTTTAASFRCRCLSS